MKTDRTAYQLMPRNRPERDPAEFFRNPPKPEWTPEQYDAFREKMRAADIEKAKRLYKDLD